MTPGPRDGKCANPAGGPDGMPLALKLNEGLGVLVPERDIADYEYGDDDWLDDEPTCDRCRGDTMDPWCDYLLPCPACQGGAAAMTLAERIDELVAQHGSLRAVARVTEIDVGYLSRLRAGEKVNPQKNYLRRLGLRRVVTFERLKTPNVRANLPP